MSQNVSVVQSAQELATTKRDKAILKREGVARFLMRKANVARTESVTDFAKYVDAKGNAASNAAKYNMGLNAKIQKLFGVSRDEMTDELMLSVVAQIDQDIAIAHETGIKHGLLREQIRKNAHRLCELGYENYERKKKLLGV